MTARNRVAAMAFALLLAAAAAEAQQASLMVDTDLAKRGRSLFTNKGCTACHTIAKGKRAGPDLGGVTTLRELDWLRRFLADPTAMFDSDSLAQALLAEYKGVKMPNLRLREQDIEALLHYIQQESEKAAGNE